VKLIQLIKIVIILL